MILTELFYKKQKVKSKFRNKFWFNNKIKIGVKLNEILIDL
jgi:hypothetical protein